MDDAAILVTGHTGFVGRAVGARFDQDGIRWQGVSSRSGVALDDDAALEKLPATPTIVHLAGRVGVAQSWDQPYQTHRANLLSTLTVMEHARRHNAHVVLLSSYVYGPPQSLPVDETHPVLAVNPYGWSKLESEMLAQSYAADFGVPVTILRLFGVYGPGQDDSQLIPSVCRQALNGDTISLADPRPRRDLLWVDDVAAAIAALTVKPTKYGCTIYNLGSGISHSVAEIVDAVLAALGPREVQWRHEYRPNEILDCVANTRRLQEDTGWMPTIDLQTGVRMMLEHMKAPPCS